MFLFDSVQLYEGARILVTENGFILDGQVLIDKGVVLTVLSDKVRKNGGSSYIDIQSSKRIPDFHNLDGTVQSGTGWHLHTGNLSKLKGKFEIISEKAIIIKDILINGINIKGKKCAIIQPAMKNDYIFVALEENVGAGSCDGLCPRGHGVMVHISDIKSEVTTNGRS